MKLKVCGMKFHENIAEAIELAPDFMGFIFYKKSSRYVGDDFGMPANIPNNIIKTGVFVNEEIGTVKNLVLKHKLGAVQLHGDENAEFVEQLKQEIGKDKLIIKSFGVSDNFDFESLLPFYNFVDYFLFDTKTIEYGGSGKKFNWNKLVQYQLNKPFFLSGGIGLNDCNLINGFSHPQLYALDVNSGFELNAGLKNIELLKEFKKELTSFF